MKKLIILLYSAFLFLFTIFSYLFVDPNLSYLKDFYSGFAFSNRLLTTISYTTAILIFFIFYGIFIYLGVKKKINLKEIFVLLSITAAILFFSYPAMLSYDIFNYIATSKVLFFYQENPYVVMPIEFVGDPLLAFTHAANKIALYGPFWILLTGMPYLLGFGNFIVTLFSFKLFIVIFYFLTVFLVWKLSKKIIPLILFALNPLVIIETLVSGHNDIVMIFLALLSFFLLAKKKIFLGTIFFILSILIKYSTILLIPVFLYVVWRLIKNKGIDWEKVYFSSSLLMLVAFLLSPIREEIYPWYAIWFISFSFLVPNKKILLYTSIAFSFSLLLRYVPYMFTGTYMGQTPFMKEIISFIPPALVFLYYVIKKKI
ncbi:MAG: hypothetical protein A3H17_02700 [Candidatus Levybacteria bacterium RIFCSPLOWO2_12_FULL_37_14]|nr:MAG: hypothetical protein US55_C0005G0016 [Candidatus Levybacteria bacterium GW2011_GWC2_37_7]OGH51040.1 MAG: hypothetical protein A3H17_02700 [Candidatus Levybacteria bacterium RIFCSPLOWO2_12_FULL_37_14]